jgi:hypothetical protein
MKPRTLKLVADVMSMQTVIAEVRVQTFAKEPELKDWTELVCPKCNTKPSYQGAIYKCPQCGESYSWWGKLKRVIQGTVEEVIMPKLLGSGEIAVANIYKMDLVTFSKYADATKQEKGLTVKDEASARNLFKLLVAMERLGQVMILRYEETIEEVVAVLTTSVSGRIILKEIIPVNLAEFKETLKVDMSKIAEKDVEEAKAFMGLIPEATEEQLKVNDYRVHSGKVAPVEQEKVVELEAILKRAVGNLPQKTEEKQQEVIAEVPRSRGKKKTAEA